ncbi:hypothetical protein JCM30760_10020 [Thiomicrorhabdus hydrogeniphila]
MRFTVGLILVGFVVLWALAIAYFSGGLSLIWLPESITKLSLPASTADLGNSLTVLDGLFTSIAIVLGLVAILFQGKELKASTDAQTLQAKALTEQIKQQEASNQLGAYSARLQFLSSEIEHMENRVPDMVLKAESLKQSNKPDDASEQWKLIKNTRAKIERFRKQANEIDTHIQSLLEAK